MDKGIKRFEILIKKDFAPITGTDVTDEELENAKELMRYFVFPPERKVTFPQHMDAYEFARNNVKKIIAL